ncbi:cytochrome P450 [Terrilactibacillus sp. S3-3]|nr:cytochrome P450 [Terrilactibacillus sp. S3-3]
MPETARILSLRLLDRIRANDVVDVEKEISEPFVRGIMSELLGLSEEDYSKVLTLATSAVSFLWEPSPSQELISTIVSIRRTFEVISEIIENGRYKENKLLDYLIRSVGFNDESLALITNVTVDGHEPFVSAVKSHIYLYLSCLNSNNKIFSEELSKKIEEKFLRLEAPFPYCARNALEDINIGGKVIKKGQRVIFFISAGNIDPYVFNDSKCPYSEEHPSKNLTFGVGRHYCLGANITD